MKKLIIWAQSFFLSVTMLQAFSWKSTDGKTIEAEFEKIDSEAVVIRCNRLEYKVPLTKLSKESRNFAIFLNARKENWAKETALLAMLDEKSLCDVFEFRKQLLEGKSYFVEGIIKSIDNGGSKLSPEPTKVKVILAEGTKIDVDFMNVANGETTKIEIEENKVILLRSTRTTHGSGFGSWRYTDFKPSKVLLEAGQTMKYRASVVNGKITTTALTSSSDVQRATQEARAQPGRRNTFQDSEIDKTKLRAAFLKESLDKTLEIGEVYSDSEKEVMSNELKLLQDKVSTE